MKNVKNLLATVALAMIASVNVDAQTPTLKNFTVDIPDKLVYTEKENVNVRTGPSLKSEKHYKYGELVTVPSYTLLPLEEDLTNWYKISFLFASDCYVSKPLFKEAVRKPIDMQSIANKKFYLNKEKTYWDRVALVSALDNTVLCENRSLMGGDGDEILSLQLGRLSPDKGLLVLRYTCDVCSIKYQPSAGLTAKASTDENHLSTCWQIVFGDAYAVVIDGKKCLDLSKVTVPVLNSLFKEAIGEDMFSYEYYSADIINEMMK